MRSPLVKKTTGDLYHCACPWCGKTMTSLWEIAPKTDGDVVETWCGWCEKPIKVIANYSYDIECKPG